jgi:hypothetical protein
MVELLESDIFWGVVLFILFILMLLTPIAHDGEGW